MRTVQLSAYICATVIGFLPLNQAWATAKSAICANGDEIHNEVLDVYFNARAQKEAQLSSLQKETFKAFKAACKTSQKAEDVREVANSTCVKLAEATTTELKNRFSNYCVESFNAITGIMGAYDRGHDDGSSSCHDSTGKNKGKSATVRPATGT